MTAGQFSQQVLESLLIPTRPGKNWAINPSIETNTTSWFASASTMTRANEDVFVGAWALKCVATGTANSGALTSVPAGTYAFVGGELVSASVRFKSVPVGRTILFHMDFRNSINGQTGVRIVGVVATGGWQEITHHQNQVPAGTVSVNLNVYAATAVVGDVLYIDGIDVRINEPGVDSYIDGDRGAGYTWVGLAHGSASTRAETMATTSLRAGKNWCLNPSFEVNASLWTVRPGSTFVRDTSKFWSGAASALLTTTTAATQGAYHSFLASSFGVPLTGVAHTLDAKVRYWLPTGQTLARVQMQMNYSDATTDQTVIDLAPGNDQWQTLSLPRLTINPAKTMSQFFLQFLGNASGAPTVAYSAYIDGVDIRLNEPDVDDYIDGAQGPGHVWTGLVHGSASTRAAPWTGPIPLTEPAIQASQVVAEVGTLRSSVDMQISQLVIEVVIAAPTAGRNQIVIVG